MRPLLPAAALAALALAYPAVSAARVARASQNEPLWATIDECRTTGGEATVGVLARMSPAGGPKAKMYVRFQLQYRDGTGWRDLPGLAARFEGIGRGERGVTHGVRLELRTQQARSFTLRATVTFQWRRHGRVLYQHVRYTTAGHGNGRYGSPAGFSAAECVVS
ncbi:MAG TPA: hypothetical protein VMA83_05915 [Solirubrobacteraceae bacterium]|nr:hypothetical protein [Solirubrobacteraceae bacterium]